MPPSSFHGSILSIQPYSLFDPLYTVILFTGLFVSHSSLIFSFIPLDPFFEMNNRRLPVGIDQGVTKTGK